MKLDTHQEDSWKLAILTGNEDKLVQFKLWPQANYIQSQFPTTGVFLSNGQPHKEFNVS